MVHCSIKKEICETILKCLGIISSNTLLCILYSNLKKLFTVLTACPTLGFQWSFPLQILLLIMPISNIPICSAINFQILIKNLLRITPFSHMLVILWILFIAHFIVLSVSCFSPLLFQYQVVNFLRMGPWPISLYIHHIYPSWYLKCSGCSVAIDLNWIAKSTWQKKISITGMQWK